MSASKTQNYQLHAWAPGDDFLREEFNENFAKLDGLYNTAVAMGTYTGDDASAREIVLGFYPRAVLLMDCRGNTRAAYGPMGGLAFRGAALEPNCNPPGMKLTQQGFQVSHTSNAISLATNNKNTVYYYIALR